MSTRYGSRARTGEAVSGFTQRGGTTAFFALGGTTVLSDGYVVHTFDSSTTFQVLAGSKNAEIFCVGGGSSTTAAGGGGGTSVTTNVALSPNNYTVTVGGVGGTSKVELGASVLATASGGTGTTSGNGFTIGPEGTGGANYSPYNYGYAGNGGGGGAGGNGGQGYPPTWFNVYDGIGGKGGDGGPGVSNSWTGTTITYGRGGGGSPGFGNGGSGSGGTGGTATANSGNGVYGQAGMSGRVVVRYLL